MKYLQIYKEDGDCGYRIYLSLIISPWTDVFHQQVLGKWSPPLFITSQMLVSQDMDAFPTCVFSTTVMRSIVLLFLPKLVWPHSTTDNTEVGVNGCYGRCQGWYATSSWAHYPSGWQPVLDRQHFHERSESTQWHYVPSQLNPAEIAFRGLDASSLVENREWKNSPEFLWQPEQCWPRLIIQKIHVETGHGGRDQVLSRLRQRYWVIHATSVCRQICKSCVSCRRHFGRTVQQQKADLPTDRVTPDQPPFTSTGVDYFGPI